MKKLKLILASLVILTFMGCDKEDAPVNTVYDNINGQTGVGFSVASRSVIVPEEGITVTVPVRVTTISTSARTFNVSVDPSSTGNSQDYTLGTVTIPAGSYEGTFTVTFGNFANLPDFVNNTLVVNLDLPDGTAVVGSKTITFTYLKAIICNDVMLVIKADRFASETTFEITDSSGAVVQSGGPFADISGGATYTFNFTLADGCYTFTIFDSFGDGLFDGNVTGNYALTCSIITLASGSGNFGSSEATDFCINQ